MEFYSKKKIIYIFLTPSSAFSDSLRDGNLKIIWYTLYTYSIISSIKSIRNDISYFRDTHHVLVLGTRALLGDGFWEHGILWRRYPNILKANIENDFWYLFPTLISFLHLTYVFVQLFGRRFVRTLIGKRADGLTGRAFNI